MLSVPEVSPALAVLERFSVAFTHTKTKDAPKILLLVIENSQAGACFFSLHQPLGLQ